MASVIRIEILASGRDLSTQRLAMMPSPDKETAVSETQSVVIDDPPTMNLLGLLLGSIIERRVALDAPRRRLEKLQGTVVVEAGQMAISMAFAGGRVTISRGAVEKPRARVRGSMEALMGIALGGGMVGPWLAGRIKTRGSLPMLLKVLPLMKT